MKIAYIVPSLRKMGPVLVVEELVKQFTERGHEVKVFYFDEYSTNTVCLPCKTERITYFSQIDFKLFDVVHTHGLRPDIYVWLHRGKNDKTHFVATMHGIASFDIGQRFKIKRVSNIFISLWMRCLKKSDDIIVLNNTAQRYYSEQLPHKHITKIYNSRTVDKTKKLTDTEREEILSFKGRDVLLGVNAVLTPIKGIDTIIASMPFIGGMKLFIAGDGSAKESLIQLAREKGVSNRVFFAGYREDAFRYIPYYDIYIMASKSEGFPIALLEAMSMKCNAVVSDIDIFKELFSEKEITFFRLGSAEDCATAIKYASSHNKGEAAYKRYQEEYSPNHFYLNHLALYQNQN